MEWRGVRGEGRGDWREERGDRGDGIVERGQSEREERGEGLRREGSGERGDRRMERGEWREERGDRGEA